MNRKYRPETRRPRKNWGEFVDCSGYPPSPATVQRIPRTRLVPGTVVWAHVPFQGNEGEKTRPAVVLEVQRRDVTLLPATTSVSRGRFPHAYIEVSDLSGTGLTRPTAIRLAPVRVDLIEVISIVGALTECDWTHVA